MIPVYVQLFSPLCSLCNATDVLRCCPVHFPLVCDCLDTVRLRKLVMFVDVLSLPWVAYPHILRLHCGYICLSFLHFFWQTPFLWLYLVVQHKDVEVCLLSSSGSPPRSLHILFQFSDSILECGSGVINLVDNQYVFANQGIHLQRRKIKPLCLGDLGARLLKTVRGRRGERFVERQAYRLYGNVWSSRLFEK